MNEQKPELNMTPMVDVTFLLLIFFMVTASFVMQRSLEVPSPKPPGDGIVKIPDADIIIEVDAYNTFHVQTADWEREAPSKHDLVIALKEARQSDHSVTIPSRMLVKAREESLHQKVVDALDAGTLVGMEEIQLTMIE